MKHGVYLIITCLFLNCRRSIRTGWIPVMARIDHSLKICGKLMHTTMCILDIFATYFFAPSFNDFDYYSETYPTAETVIEIIPKFSWPSGTGFASGITWYGGLTNEEMTEIIGKMGTFSFGWSE